MYVRSTSLRKGKIELLKMQCSIAYYYSSLEHQLVTILCFSLPCPLCYEALREIQLQMGIGMLILLIAMGCLILSGRVICKLKNNLKKT